MRAIFYYLILGLLAPIYLFAQQSDLPHRVIISTDIGGTDFDDFQSLAHLLLYADTLAIEGLISSPHGDGRKEHILECIDAYEADFNNLRHYSASYPTADSLRKVTKQGAIEIPDASGVAEPTEGSNWIIERAKAEDTRPLHVLIWGGIEDLAQALHDAPEIVPKLRVYFIGGPNKKWTVNAYQYIAENHKDLWMIEANATYRGWFLGGTQTNNLGNITFVRYNVQGFGALGDYFYNKGRDMKMGDTPSVMRLINGDVDDPSKPGWGGQYVRAWDRPHKVFTEVTIEEDSIEQFGVMELILPVTGSPSNPTATLNIDRPIEGLMENGSMKFLFSPKDANVYSYTISSNNSSLNNLSGSIKAYTPPPSNSQAPSASYPNWWTDDPAPEYEERGYIGVKTVNIWREEFLADFARRIYRAAYLPETYFQLSVNSEHGAVTQSEGDSIIKAGTTVILTAEPDYGYEFESWTGDVEGRSAKLTITMHHDVNLTANYNYVLTNKPTEQLVNVYPNYVKDKLAVEFLNQDNSNKQVQLVDLSGKTLYHVEVSSDQSAIEINTQGLVSSRLFVLRVQLEGHTFTKVLVKD